MDFKPIQMEEYTLTNVIVYRLKLKKVRVLFSGGFVLGGNKLDKVKLTMQM